ncbi:MAG: hypothetical protein Q4B26_11430 [Eubacteriales bacterium]|nr:hypothetical protein [Eubacteriales bacterium]
MRKSVMRKHFKRTTVFLAAAAVSASLFGAPGIATFASDASGKIEVSALIPDNITIQSPARLSDIRLPESSYGTLKWADDSQYADERSESFEVVFVPGKDVDLSGVSGWDSGAGKLRGYVTVVITDLEEGVEEPEEEQSDETVEPEGTEESVKDEDDGTTEAPADADETEVTDENPAADADEPENSAEADEPADDADNTNTEDADTENADTDDAQETPVPTEEPEVTPAAESEDSADEDPNASVTPAAGENTQETEITVTPTPESIFDQDLPVDDRPDVAAEDLTEEEMFVQGEINHSSGGICVTGVELPWYVQFRVSDGSAYQFSNASDAKIFKSYEFELWDLKNNTEYEIPDGQYISVMIPVTAGYNYTVEHLLDNGAVESIVPTLDGSTLIFSTHSFSPFGIAGSTPVVGGDIAENNYATPTPVPNTTTAAPTTAPGNNGNNNNGNNGGNNSGSSSSNGQTGNNGSTNGGSNIQNQNVTPTPETSNTRNVETGDNTPIVLFIVLAILACAVIAGALIWLLNRK